MTITLAEALRAALLSVGIGEPDIQQTQQSIFQVPTNPLYELTLEEAQELAEDPKTDPQTLNALRFRLESALQSTERNLDNATTTQTIVALLPQLETAIVAHGNRAGFPSDNTLLGQIHDLQETLNISIDGVFGDDTAKALTRFLATQIGSDNELGASIDIQDTPSLESFLRSNTNSDFFNYTQLVRLQESYEQDLSSFRQNVGTLTTENAQLNARLNTLINTELEECIGHVINLDGHNPFVGIIDRVRDPYTNFDSEISGANENVAAAIIAECSNYFEDIPEDLRDQLINDFVARVEGPIADGVNRYIQNARDTHERLIFIRGAASSIVSSGLPTDSSNQKLVPN